MPTIANGFVGTAIGSDKVFINGVYSGQGIQSHRAVIPSVLDVNIELGDSVLHREYSLNVAEGI